MQIHGHPEAADIVFTSRADTVAVGINITTQVGFTGLVIDTLICLSQVQGLTIFTMWGSVVLDEDLLELRNSKGNHAQFLSDMFQFYTDWHMSSLMACYMHLSNLTFTSQCSLTCSTTTTRRCSLTCSTTTTRGYGRPTSPPAVLSSSGWVWSSCFAFRFCN